LAIAESLNRFSTISAGRRRNVYYRMRPDLRPFFAFLDVLLEIATPPYRETLRFELARIVVQDVDVALEISNRNQFFLAIAIDVDQTEPAIGAAVV